jgi:hypothetical protein
LLDLTDGCVFHPRCPLFVPGVCDRIVPPLLGVGEGRDVACHVVARERGVIPALPGARTAVAVGHD